MMIVGASAGGGLAAGCALLARDRGGPRLTGQVLLCPMLDDRDRTVSSAQFDGIGVWDRASNIMGWSCLLGERRAGDDVSIYAAPARARDLSGLPPAFIDCGSAEVFRDEDVAYASALWASGVQAEPREAVRRGFRPIIAGRSMEKLAPLAAELGLEHRAFAVDNARNHRDDVGAVLNCAGPFSQTAAMLVGACIARGVHYVDVTGEIPALAHCHRLDAEARSAGVILCPGAGFDVVPTDCLAATLKARLPEAISLNLAFSFGTKPSVGTAKTTVEGLKQGGMIRRDHKLTRVPDGYDIRRIPFPLGERWAATVPYGDVFTAGVTTGIPNIMVYLAAPLAAGIAMKLANPIRPLLATAFVQQRLTRLVERVVSGGPEEKARAEQRTEFWGEAVDTSGNRVALGFSAPNVYALTVDTALEVLTHCSSPTGKSGFFTPSMLLGPGFISTRPGVTPMVDL